MERHSSQSKSDSDPKLIEPLYISTVLNSDIFNDKK